MTQALPDPQSDRSGRDETWLGAMHPRFTSDITLGHLVQAVLIVTTLGGGVLAGYLNLRDAIDMQQAEFSVALAGHEARLTEAEHALNERRAEERQFQAEMRTAIQRVMQAIADLRTDLVRKQDRKD
jgi:hypothetical protein